MCTCAFILFKYWCIYKKYTHTHTFVTFFYLCCYWIFSVAFECMLMSPSKGILPSNFSVNINHFQYDCLGGAWSQPSPPPPAPLPPPHRGCRTVCVVLSCGILPVALRGSDVHQEHESHNFDSSFFVSAVVFASSSGTWQHEGTQTWIFGVMMIIMVRFKYTFPPSCSWGFIQSAFGFSQRDGYKFVRNIETFSGWDFGWVFVLNYRTHVCLTLN